MILKISVAFAFFSLITHQADAAYPSAHRPLKTSFKVFETEARMRGADKNLTTARKSALSSAKIYTSQSFVVPTKWSPEALHERFIRVRDHRFLDSASGPRRATWLYPDDGCYARAALINQNFFRWYEPVPNKVFAFGNLRVKTNNSPRGRVGWWYHVATIVEVNGENFVLDPSIEFNQPLTLTEWVTRMGNPDKIKVAICNTGTYSPSDSCDKETRGIELSAQRAAKHYMNLESERMKKLGRENEL